MVQSESTTALFTLASWKLVVHEDLVNRDRSLRFATDGRRTWIHSLAQRVCRSCRWPRRCRYASSRYEPEQKRKSRAQRARRETTAAWRRTYFNRLDESEEPRRVVRKGEAIARLYSRSPSTKRTNVTRRVIISNPEIHARRCELRGRGKTIGSVHLPLMHQLDMKEPGNRKRHW